MPKLRSPKKLIELFNKKTVVDLPTIRSVLGDVSVQTAFRYLGLVPYRRSYNHNGRFYVLYKVPRFDRAGLWSFEGIHFSNDGSLRNTVRRFVYDAPAGASHRELCLKLQLKVHNTLLELCRKDEIIRESFAGFYVYLHPDASVREGQLAQRRELIAVARAHSEVTDTVIVEVLLILIRHPGASFADMVRRLRGHSPPIRAEHVRVVFDRYDLEHLGKKKGSSRR